MKHVNVVGAVITNEEGEILCALRSRDMSLGGLWEFPGGKLEDGETPEQTLVREIQEELHCDISVGEYITTFTYEYPSLVVTLATYYARIVSGSPTPIEHEKLVWLPTSQLSTLSWAPADVPTVERLMGFSM